MKKIIKTLCLVFAVSVSVFAFAGCRNNKKIESAADLYTATVGAQSGTTGLSLAQKYKDGGAKVKEFEKTSDAVSALTSGKLDCVILDKEPAKKFAEHDNSLKILEESFKIENYAICVAKTNDELLAKIDSAIRELKKAGIIDRIMKNYIGNGTVGTCPYVTPEETKYPNGELHMATATDFEPYIYVNDGRIVGIDAEIAQAICDKLGYKLVIDDMSFASVFTAVQNGKADFGMAGITVTDERRKNLNFTDSYASTVQVILVNG